MATATATATNPSVERYLRAARDAGCPRDQVENFLRSGLVLQPRQLIASATARLCDQPDGPTEIAYGGARGGGKSFWGLAQIFCDDAARFEGLKFLYLRKVGKAGKEAIGDLRREVLHSTPHEYKQQEAVMIRKDNGSRVVLGHFQNDRDIDNYLGLQYDGALIEEATQLTSQKVKDIRTCVRTSKPGWRPRLYLTTNPGNVGHAWFKRRFIDPHRQEAETETRFIQATVYDNQFVNPEYRTSLESLTGWQRRAWLHGDWDIAAGQYFTTWRQDVHVRSDIEIENHWRLWVAIDYGFRHYTAVYLFGQNDEGDVFVVDEHAERQWLTEAHVAAIDAMLVRHGLGRHDIEQFVAGGDVFSRNRDGRTVADDYASHGILLTRADNDRRAGAAEMLRRLGDVDRDPPIPPTLFVSDRCPRLIECIPSLMHDDTRSEDVQKVDCDDDGLGGDDFYDAARYGLMVAAKPPATWGDDPRGDYWRD